MYLSGTNSSLAQAVLKEIPPGLLKKTAEDEARKYNEAKYKDAYFRKRVAELMKLHDDVLADVKKYEEKAREIGDENLRLKALKEISKAVHRLSLMKRLLSEMKPGANASVNGIHGLGNAGFWATLAQNPATVFVAPIGFAIAIGLGAALISGLEHIKEIIPAVSTALKIAVAVVGVSAGVLGVIWMARIIRDIWEADKKEKKVEAERPRTPIVSPRTP